MWILQTLFGNSVFQLPIFKKIILLTTHLTEKWFILLTDTWTEMWEVGWNGRLVLTYIHYWLYKIDNEWESLVELPRWHGGKESACQCRRHKRAGLVPGQEDLLEKEMAICSSILAWIIPWTEKPGGLQSMGLQRVRQNWATEHKST